MFFSSVVNLLSLQLCDQTNVNQFLPTFTFLGNLIEAVPDMAHILVTHYGETMTK